MARLSSCACSILLVALVTLWPQDKKPGYSTAANENLNATLWVQTAAEYRGLAFQAFNAAGFALPHALADRNWTAALEQSADTALADKPPAIIIDIDETVLDNSPFQARLIADGTTYNEDRWKIWVDEIQASSVPGVLRFLTNAAQQGVTIFYVSNRRHVLEESTRANLTKLGFPLTERFDTVLLKNEREDWGPNKSSRRKFVAATHRILFLIGDDLGDFLPQARSTPKEREAATREFQAYWGSRWYMLPNPTYGTWERSLNGFKYPKREQALKLKRGHLDIRRR